MDHQDWKQVILRNPNAPSKKEAEKKKLIKKPVQHNSNNLSGGVSFKKLDGDDVQKLEKVSKNDVQKIQQARLAQKMSQKDLANRLNVKQTVINELESGKMNKNNQFVSKVKKVLRIQ